MTTLHAKDTAETSPVATQDDVAVLPDEALNDVHGGLDIGAVGSAIGAMGRTAVALTQAAATTGTETGGQSDPLQQVFQQIIRT